MPELVPLKIVQISRAIINYGYIALNIWTFFNESSSGIYQLAFEKIIIILESRKDLPL